MREFCFFSEYIFTNTKKAVNKEVREELPEVEMKADLHCHTSISDGSLGIEDLLILARNSGLDKLAITDQDCIASSVRGSTIAKRMDGFDVVIGCEFTATDPKTKNKVRILCYNPDSPERLERLCISNTNIHIKAGKIIAKRAAEKFHIPGKYIISCAQGSNYISKLHVMKALLNCGYTTTIFGELYDKLFAIKGTDDYIGVNPMFPDPRNIITEIHGAGGIAVFAHPGYDDNIEVMKELADEGLLDGIEIWTPKNTPEQQEELIAFAKEKDLLMVGGSDFRGAYNKEAITLGTYTTPDENFSALMSYKSRKNRRKNK